MDKTEKLTDWKEDERKDRNRDGIDDDLEPAIPDVSAGSRKLARRLRENTDTDQNQTFWSQSRPERPRIDDDDAQADPHMSGDVLIDAGLPECEGLRHEGGWEDKQQCQPRALCCHQADDKPSSNPDERPRDRPRGRMTVGH